MSDPEDEGLAERPPEMATRPGPRPQPAATEADPRSFNPGTLLAGRFGIVRFVARGGMGGVDKAEYVGLDELVALKTIRRELASEPKALDRIKTEIHLARKVTNPTSVASTTSSPSWVEAGSAKPSSSRWSCSAARRWRSTWSVREGSICQEALPLVREVAQALGAAHRAGVIHRDFKSSNVVLVPAPEEARGCGRW
jgi:serine/threonine protein kinase